jgi:cytoskeletal protein CcmA (bactofilin family)
VWNSKQKEDFETRTPVEPVRSVASAPGSMPIQSNPRAAAPTATIGAAMHIKGEIRSGEELLVDGDVEGSMESQSLLTVGPSGKVKANIRAREVIIFGSVRGDVEVSEKIAIRGQGSLIGNIKSAGIVIDDGAYFKGSIDIVRNEPKPTAKAAEPKIAAAS